MPRPLRVQLRVQPKEQKEKTLEERIQDLERRLSVLERPIQPTQPTQPIQPTQHGGSKDSMKGCFW